MPRLKQCLLALFLLLFSQAANAQSPANDSLTVFHRLDSLYNVMVGNPAQAISICLRMEVIANQLQADTLILEATIDKGDALDRLGLYDMAMKEYYDVLHLAARVSSPFYEAAALYSIGKIYTNQKDYKRSKTFLENAKAKFIVAGSFADTVRANVFLAYTYCATGEMEVGLSMVKKNIADARKMNDKLGYISGLGSLSHIYFEQRNYEQALSSILEILSLVNSKEHTADNAGTYNHIAEIYVAMKQWGKAQKYLDSSFIYAKESNAIDWLFDCYRLQSEIDEATGNYKGALEAHKSYQRFYDSIFNNNYENKIASLSSLYELEKKQDKILLLEKDNQISTGKVRQEMWRRKAIVAGAVLIIGMLIAGFLIKIQTRTKKLQIAFSRSLIQNQETERQRISRELHDSVGQNVLFIKNQLLVHSNDPSFTQVMEAIGITIDEVRDISKDLYPSQLDKYGLPATLNALAEKISDTTGIFVSVDLQEIENDLSKKVNINLYRIAQEGLNNAIKYAEAKAIRITGAKANGKIVLAIMDNGKGFDTGIRERKAQTSSGLLNMEERAKMLGGKMELESGATGTKVTITIPVKYDI